MKVEHIPSQENPLLSIYELECSRLYIDYSREKRIVLCVEDIFSQRSIMDIYSRFLYTPKNEEKRFESVLKGTKIILTQE